ncbi:hypothetical protein ACFLU6_09120 [Acidobacteriota bacterium]
MVRKSYSRMGLQFFLVFAISALPAFAVIHYEGSTDFKGPIIELPNVIQATSDPSFQTEMIQTHAPFISFKEQHGPDWFARMDRRTLRPAMIWGSGISWDPAATHPPTVDGDQAIFGTDFDETRVYLETKAREFTRLNPDLFGLEIDGRILSLEAARVAGPLSGRLWSVTFDVHMNGIPIRGAQAFFRVNHGNLIQFGIRHIGDTLASVPITPRRNRDQAKAAVVKQGGEIDPVTSSFLDEGTLVILPVAEDPRRYEGPPGQGLSYRLAWRFSFHRKGEIPTWVSFVDAVSGEIIAFYDDNKYDCQLPIRPQGRVTGGVYPRAVGDPEEVRAMPYTTVIHGGTLTTDYNGIFPQTPGTPSETGLNGAYVNLNCQVCTNPRQAFVSNNTGGDLYLGTGGLNTAGNGFSVPSERNVFYHLNVARAMASKHLANNDTNNYLDRNAPANVNIADTCNAFWNGTSSNFFQAGGGCNNTGEIADVIIHEWGHGLDQATTPAVWDGARGEGLSDTIAFLATHSPVMAPYFRVGDPNGIRNADENASSRGFLSVSNLLSKCPAGSGPNGGEVHCEGEIFAQVNWRLGVNLRSKYGAVGGWFALERLHFGHLPLADTYVPDQSGSAYDAYIAVDDDNGNLADGTPNAEAINDAFDSHEIASSPLVADSPECTPPVAPVPALSVLTDPDTQLYQVRVAWNGVAGAVQYDVLRNEDGPNEMSVLIGTVLPPFPPDPIELIDDDVFDGKTYYYRIRVFDSAGCVSVNDTNQSVTLNELLRVGFDGFRTDDSQNNFNGIVEPGETITLEVTVVNLGGAANNTFGTLTTNTSGVTILTSRADFGFLSPGATDTTEPPHFTFQVDNDPSLCGEIIIFDLTVEADEGCSYASFQVPIGIKTGSTVLLSDEFETDTGWIVDPESTDDATTGIWERGDPFPTNFVQGDDHTPAGTDCWITGNLNDPNNGGADDVDGGCTTLQSPPGWDFGSTSGIELVYWRYYVVETRLDDEFLVQISNDGGNLWQTLETVQQTTTPFTEAIFDLDEALGAPAAQVALRFTACDTGGGSLIEALLDDLKFEVPIYTCEDPAPRPRLALFSHSLDDGIALGEGNGDGIPDPNETIVIPLTLENTGMVAAESVSATLALGAAPPGIAVIDDFATYADISPAGTEVSAGPDPLHYSLKIGPDPNNCGKEIPLEVTMSYGSGTRTYVGTGSFSIQIGVVNQVTMFFDDFETPGDNGWTHVEILEQDDWQHDTPTGNNIYDAPSAYSGTRIWGNDLAMSGWNGNYRDDVHNYLESPSIDMRNSVGSTLVYQRWLSVEDAVYDQAIISVNGTPVWQNPAGSGTDHLLDTNWVEHEIDISAIADGDPAVQIRYELISDPGANFGGWNIDDVRLISNDAICNPFDCTAPAADPVGNLLRAFDTGTTVTLDWNGYTGSAFGFNIYRAELRTSLPFDAPSLRWTAHTGSSLNDAIPPGDPDLIFYNVRAINDCFEEAF